MSDKLDATISITADTSGVEAGVDKTKKSLKTLGSAAQQASGKISESGKAAGAGMDAIGRGSEQAAKAVERSTRSMQLQLQRQIAEMQAGGKATREYTEALARMRGVDVANLRPLLDQLDAARKKTDDAKKSAEGFAGGLASMKTAVAGFATALAGGALFARFIAETKAAEQEQAQLAAVLKSTGEAAGWSQAQLNKMADTLASKSTYSSGAINEAQTRLLSYTNIAGKEFPRAMQAVIDMSARMGMDVKSSAETIGRALDIPSEGLTALTRQGFRFTESQKEMVKQLEATGRASDAQAIILEALESSYGGAAEAARNTFGGALQSVQNSIGSLLTADSSSMPALRQSVEDLNAVLGDDSTRAAFHSFTSWIAGVGAASVTSAANLVTFLNIVRGRDTIANASQDSKNLQGQSRYLMQQYELMLKLSEADPDNANYAKQLVTLRAELDQVSRSMSGASDQLKEVTGSTAAAAAVTKEAAAPALASMAKSGAAGAAGLKNVESAYATLSKRVNEYISQLALEAKQGDKVTAAQKLQIQLDELLAKSKGKLAAAEVARLKAGIQSALSMEKEAAASKLAADQAEEAAKAYDSVLDATMGRTKSLADQIKAEEEAAAAIGLSKEAVAALEMAKLSDMAATIERKALLMDDIDLSGQQSAALRAEAQAYRDLASVKGQRAVKQANADTAKKAKEDWEKVSKTIGDTLADYIMGGGKDAATYLKRLFATLVLQPIVQTTVGSIFGGSGGAQSVLGGSNGGVLGTASNLNSLYGAFSGGITSSIGGAIGSLGSMFGSSALTSFAAGIKGSTLAAGLAGPTTAGASGAMGLGASFGAALPWIAGGLAVASLFGGSLFGRKLKDSGIEGTFGGDQGFTGNTFEYYKGGLLRKSKTKRNPLDEGTRSQFADQFTGAQTSIKSMGDILGLVSDAVDGATYSIKLSLKGLSEEDASKAIQAEFDRIADSMAGLVLVTNEYSIADESRIDTLMRLSSSLTTFNLSLEQIGLAAYEAGLKSADAAYKMISAFGSLENYGQAFQSYYEKFYSERERMDRANAQITQALNDLGYAINPYLEGSKSAFRTLVEEALMSGQVELAAQVMAMSDAFAKAADYGTKIFEEMAKSAEEAAEAAAEAAEAARELAYANLEAAVGREQDYWQSIASASQEAISTLSSTLSLLTSNARALYGTVDSTQQMLAAQGMVYIEDALSAVRGGGSITGFDQLQDAISAARGGISGKAYSSQFERERDALVLAGQLSELGDLTGEQLSIEERQLKNAEAQLDGLDQTLKYWRQLLDGNASQIDATLSIPRAIEQLARLMGLDADGGLWGGAGGAGGGAGDDGGASWGAGSGAAGSSKPADRYDALRNVFRHYYGTGDEYGLLSSAKANGYTLRDVTAVSAAMYPDIWGGSTYEQWLEVAKGVGLPAFAGGGMHSGGLRLVGERGWEVEATGPSRIWNQQQLGQALGGGNNAELMAGMLAEMRALRAEVAALKSSAELTANNTRGIVQMTDQLDTVAGTGRVLVKVTS